MRAVEWTEPPAVVGTVCVVGAGTAVAAEHSSNTGPILAFAAVVLGAMLTAYFADRRQTKALAAESGRNEQRLQHDRDLKAMELAHDRRMREADHLRTLFDEASAVVARAFTAYASASRAYQREPEAGKGEDRKQTIRQQHKALASALVDGTFLVRRMTLRLELTNPAPAAYRDILGYLEAGRQPLLGSLTWPPLESDLATIQTNGRAAADALDSFMTAGRAYVGAKLTQG
jgi:hypothetical protein